MKLTAKFDLKDPVKAAECFSRIRAVRDDIADLEGTHKRLLKAAFSWFRSSQSKVDLLRAAGAFNAFVLGPKRDKLSDLLFEHDVLTLGRRESYVEKAAAQIAADIERDILYPTHGLAEVLDHPKQYPTDTSFTKKCCYPKVEGQPHTAGCYTNFQTHYVGDSCPGGHKHAWVKGEVAGLVETNEGKTEKYPSKRGHRKTINNVTRAELRQAYRALNQEEFNIHLHAAQAASSGNPTQSGSVDDALYTLYTNLIPGDLRLHLAALEEVAVERATTQTKE